MRVLVSGGAGHIGSHLCEVLDAEGDDVICVDDLSTGDLANLSGLRHSGRFTFVERDVSRPLAISGRVDTIYHLASPASPVQFVRIPLPTLSVNSVGTWNLLDLAEERKARFVLASTSEVYGDPAVHPQPETYWGNVNPTGPRSCYDESKRFGEALVSAFVRQGRVDGRIVRIFNTYGPRIRVDDGRMVPSFISQALRQEPLTIFGSGRQTRSLCYVLDTVEGIRRMMSDSLSPGEVVNVGGTEERTVDEYAALISDACGVPLRTTRLELPCDDPMRRRPDISKAKRLLQWEPSRSLEEGLGQTVAWFRDQLGVRGRDGSPGVTPGTLPAQY